MRAMRRALAKVSGYYALAVLASTDDGTCLLAMRQGPPLVVGITEGGGFLSSDVLGLIPHTRQVIYLEDGDLAQLEPGRLTVTDASGAAVERPAREIEWDPADSGRGGYPHYMLKEIHEQPDVIERTCVDRIDLASGDVRFEGGAFDDAVLQLDRAHSDPRMRDRVARRSDRSLPDRGTRGPPGGIRLRLGVPLPLTAGRAWNRGPRDHPVG